MTSLGRAQVILLGRARVVMTLFRSLFLVCLVAASTAFALSCYEGTRSDADGRINVTLSNCTNQSASYNLCLTCYLPAGVRPGFSGNTYACGNQATLQFSSVVGAQDCVACSTDACNTSGASRAALGLLSLALVVVAARKTCEP